MRSTAHMRKKWHSAIGRGPNKPNKPNKFFSIIFEPLLPLDVRDRALSLCSSLLRPGGIRTLIGTRIDTDK